MTTARIRAAFEAPTNSWAAGLSPAMPIAWTNVQFTQPDGRYAKAFLIPSRTVSRDLGGVNRSYAGVFQVSLYLPIGTGPAMADALAASLDQAFPVGTELVSGSLRISLTTPMSPADAFEDASRYVVPVSCTYRAEDYPT